jgi:hypothetical protein
MVGHHYSHPHYSLPVLRLFLFAKLPDLFVVGCRHLLYSFLF